MWFVLYLKQSNLSICYTLEWHIIIILYNNDDDDNNDDKNNNKLLLLLQEYKFTKCGVCVALKFCLQGTTDEEKRKNLSFKRKKHNEQQMYVPPWIFFQCFRYKNA